MPLSPHLPLEPILEPKPGHGMRLLKQQQHPRQRDQIRIFQRRRHDLIAGDLEPETVCRTGVLVVQELGVGIGVLIYVVEGCGHHVDEAGEQVEALDVRCVVGDNA